MKAKARERLAALVDPAIDTLAHVVTQREDKHLGLALAASRDVLDRAGYGADQPERAQDNRTLIVNLLGGKPVENVREMALGLLTGANGNGNGSRG